MTFPYGSVWRDKTDGEIVAVICEAKGEVWWEVVILVASSKSVSYPPVGTVTVREIDLPVWERVE